jgi:hypothetical protein
MASKPSDAEVLQNIITQLGRLDRESRLRIMRAVSAYFGEIADGGATTNAQVGRAAIFPHLHAHDSGGAPSNREATAYSFEGAAHVSPKEFLASKRPSSDVERVTCLAFYLSHMEKQKSFKTLDISRLNTEAAQPKLSNVAYALSNATRAGFLAGALKGQRQLTAAGERYVQELPDRQKARDAAAAVLPKRRLYAKKRTGS